MTEKIPEWALNYIKEELPQDAHVINAMVIKGGSSSGTILANTSKGAILVKKSVLGEPKMWHMPVAKQHVAFTCSECSERVELVNPSAPRDVYCSGCGTKYHLSANSTVLKVEIPMPAIPVKPENVPECTPKEEPQIFKYGDYTLYSRDVKLKNGGVRTIYFFSKHEPKSGKQSPMPEGYEVGVNNKTGLPFLRKSGKKPKEVKAEAPPAPQIPFKHGDYTLYARKVKLKNGGEVEIYFFSKHKPVSGHVAPMPEGRVVGVNRKTGLPFLRKKEKPEEEGKKYRPQCAAITDSGGQCRNSARAGSKYCIAHKGYQPPTAGAIMELMNTAPKTEAAKDVAPAVLGKLAENDAESGGGKVQCAAVTEDGIQCKNIAREGSKYCAAHKRYHPKSAKSLAGMRDTKPKVENAPDTVPSVRKQSK
ncbi:MAG: hypothetical protein PHH26_02440 [Candidatus Thermoplasmatota archaeon]|nr:hypothetical protein [Candidatus Thermoplasmatota archaeon]